ncbi:hypothetical protein BDP27DRAFT_108161 [Rhodocollybia butyracea]|uniref:Uncharacterized protein n=1 Tax=Rhodocollybia butyracea TaxID=206335 RepID=A0A9P5PN66_9AGAR|nr:hypothetical protein BDP27DRAFT_108161 [Rhodocollybia butyracea]
MLRVTLASDRGPKAQPQRQYPQRPSSSSSSSIPISSLPDHNQGVRQPLALKPHQNVLRTKLERVLIADADAKAKARTQEEVLSRMNKTNKMNKDKQAHRRGVSLDAQLDMGVGAGAGAARARAGSDTTLLGWFWRKDEDESDGGSAASSTDDDMQNHSTPSPPPQNATANGSAARTHARRHTQSGFVALPVPVSSTPQKQQGYFTPFLPNPNLNSNPNPNPYPYPYPNSKSISYDVPPKSISQTASKYESNCTCKSSSEFQDTRKIQTPPPLSTTPVPGGSGGSAGYRV